MEAACLEHRLTDNENQTFDSDGFLSIPGALSADVVNVFNESIDRIVAKREDDALEMNGEFRIF